MRRAALYTRVSTPEQAKEGYSLAAQEAILRAHCERHNYTPTILYSDEGISGKSISRRPGLRALLENANAGAFDAVVIWKLSRLTRSLLDLCLICNKFNSLDISLISISESFDTSTPAGRMMLHMLGACAEFEREVIGENVRLGLAGRAAQGKPTAAYVLGYERGKDMLRVIPEEAEIVHYIFDTYLELQSVHAVAEQCQKRSYHGKKDGQLHPSSIHRILTNVVYCGYNRYGNSIYKGRWEPILSPAIFNKAQVLLSRRSSGRKRRLIITIP